MEWMCIHMPIPNSWGCSNTLYRYDMDMRCSLKGSTDSTVVKVLWFAHIHHLDFWLTLPNLGNVCGRCSNISMNAWCSLKGSTANYSVVVWVAHLHHLGFQPTLPNLGNVCGGNGVNVHPYAHSQQSKMLKERWVLCLREGFRKMGSLSGRKVMELRD